MKISRQLQLVPLLVMALGLSGCAKEAPPAPTHKVKTTACLIRSSQEVPGTPDKQIATDLVEAKVVYGLNVREVKINKEVTSISPLLLKALQGGCVLMISSNTLYQDALAKFAGEHPKMLVLFIGKSIPEGRQAPNFRWVADDVLGGAKLAGYLAAAKSTTGEVFLSVQPAYFQAKSIASAFKTGVKDFESETEKEIKVNYSKPKTGEDLSVALANLTETDVAAVFAGPSVWSGFPAAATEKPFVIGADLSSETSAEYMLSVQGSLERNISEYVLDAVSSLLNRKVSSEPLYRKPDALKLGINDLTVLIPDSVDGTLLEALAVYKEELVAKRSR